MKSIKTITLTDARKALRAMEKKALKSGINFCFCIVDTRGSILILEKMENASMGSVEMAIAKAETSFKTHISTKEIHKLIKDNGFDFGYTSPSCKTAIPGGIPLIGKNDNDIVGAIGVSGGPSDIDEKLALEGKKAINLK